MNEPRIENGEGGHMMLAFLAGALVGASLGVLLAPKPGKETRKQLSDLAHKAREKAGDVAAKLRQHGDGEARSYESA